MVASPAGTPRVAIVGGGIGGLAAAAVLHRAGLPSTVYAPCAATSHSGSTHHPAPRDQPRPSPPRPLPDGPEQQARDASLADADPLVANGWIYAHDAEAEAAATLV